MIGLTYGIDGQKNSKTILLKLKNEGGGSFLSFYDNYFLIFMIFVLSLQANQIVKK